jgi:low affinity Fe/Cu permease
MYIGVLVLLTLFKLNVFSPDWNIIVGLVVTAVLFILSGLIGGDLPA